jgi:hypothetical protein
MVSSLGGKMAKKPVRCSPFKNFLWSDRLDVEDDMEFLAVGPASG